MDSAEQINRWAGKYVLAIAVVHLSLLVYGIFSHGPGWDEVGHLPAGLSHWKTGRFDLYRVNPPLVRMFATAPLVFFDDKLKWQWDHAYRIDRPEWDLGRELIEAHGPNYFVLLRISRLTCLPFSALAMWVIWRWSRELFGVKGALLSVTLWCFSPNVITNAQMITPDTAATACGVLACYVFRCWLWQKTIGWAYLAGLTLGLAELTKFTWLILYAVWPLQWFIDRCVGAYAKPSWRTDLGHLFMMFAISLFTINVGYGFEGTFQRLGDYQFFSRTLGGWKIANSNHWIEGNLFAGTDLAAIPVPLPVNYVLGIDRQKVDFERGFPSYLRGEWRDHGWWYYYLYGLLVKEPAGFLLLLGWALFTALRMKYTVRGIIESVCVLLPGLTLLVFVSSQTGFNHHLRYVLPSWSFLSIALGICCVQSPSNRWSARIAWGLVSAGVVSSLLVFPHSHAYFNEFVGGPRKGPLHLLDSNFDWGQDLLLLEKWAKAHPNKPLDGVVHTLPLWLGVQALTSLPKTEVPRFFPESQDSRSNSKLVPGRYAVSIIHTYTKSSGYEYFRKLTPVAQVGYTIFIYELTAAQIHEIEGDRDSSAPPPIRR